MSTQETAAAAPTTPTAPTAGIIMLTRSLAAGQLVHCINLDAGTLTSFFGTSGDVKYWVERDRTEIGQLAPIFAADLDLFAMALRGPEHEVKVGDREVTIDYCFEIRDRAYRFTLTLVRGPTRTSIIGPRLIIAERELAATKQELAATKQELAATEQRLAGVERKLGTIVQSWLTASENIERLAAWSAPLLVQVSCGVRTPMMTSTPLATDDYKQLFAMIPSNELPGVLRRINLESLVYGGDSGRNSLRMIIEAVNPNLLLTESGNHIIFTLVKRRTEQNIELANALLDRGLSPNICNLKGVSLAGHVDHVAAHTPHPKEPLLNLRDRINSMI